MAGRKRALIVDLAILTALASAKGKRIDGRTYLQKIMFFVDRSLSLGIPFRAYLFGPYSESVSESVAYLVGLGLVEERRERLSCESFLTMEPAKYSYCLSAKGEEVSRLIESSSPEFARQVASIVKSIQELPIGRSAHELSLAAKVRFLIEMDEKVDVRDLVRSAMNVGWSITQSQVESVYDSLRNLQLAEKP